ncbi:MAG: FtsX-like permease family protein [Chloroflexi bacterium]|nr:FtsX-like permease family protein [Chloroflexota bacterium]
MIWSFQKAFNDIRRRKIRSGLTIVGIFIGVAGIVAIVATARNLEEAQRYNYANSSQDDMRWWVWNNTPTTEYALSQVPNVAAVQRRANYYTRFRWDNTWHDVTFYGLEDYSKVQVNRIDFVEGRPPQSGEVAFEISTKQLLPDLKLGDVITYRVQPQNQEYRFTLSGFVKSPAYPSATLLNYSTAYATANDVRRMLGISGDNEILLRVNDLAGREETRRQVEDIFRKRNLQFSGYVARDPNNFLGKQEIEVVVLLLLVFSGVGLVISGFLVANTLSAIVTEQVGEIGTLKALGAGRWSILQVYLFGALIYGLIGTALGIVGGFVGGKFLLGFLGGTLNFEVDQFLFQPEALGLGVVVGIGVTLASALIPAWAGTAISVREALDSYGITSTYGQGRVDRILTKLQKLPPLVALSLRNLSRRKTRNLITLGVIALSSAAFLAAQSTSTSVDGTIDHLYNVYGADGWMQFDSDVNENLAQHLKAVPGVMNAEAWMRGRVTVKATTTDMYGVPPNTTIYKKQVSEGRWFTTNENNVVTISANLAHLRSIKVGDYLEVEYNRQRETMQVVGILDDNSKFLGSSSVGKVFMPLSVAQRLKKRQGLADFFAIVTTEHDPATVETVLATIENRYRELSPSSLTAYSDRNSTLQITAILRLLLYSMTAIIAVIGAIGVVNTLTLNVLERRREIGVLRTIGGTNQRLVQIFLTEGLFLGLLGFIVGLILGYPLAQVLTNVISQAVFPVDFIFEPQMVIGTFAFALLLTTAASLGPAIGAARVNISSSLRF